MKKWNFEIDVDNALRQCFNIIGGYFSIETDDMVELIKITSIYFKNLFTKSRPYKKHIVTLFSGFSLNRMLCEIIFKTIAVLKIG